MRSPAITSIAVAALALGIGANTICFTTVNVVLLRPLPFRDLGSLVEVSETYPRRGDTRDLVSPPDFLDWRERARSFAQLSAFTAWDANLTGVDEAERLQGFAVSHEFFPALGMPPLAGRTFTAAEEQPGRDQVVVISHGLWQRRFAGDSHIAGRKISLNGLDYTVVGVMPEDFDFPLATDVWKPLAFSPAERANRDSRYLVVLGRLENGVSVGRASAEMSSVTQALAAQYPSSNAGRGVRVETIRSVINNVTDRFTLVLMAAAGFVLLLALFQRGEHSACTDAHQAKGDGPADGAGRRPPPDRASTAGGEYPDCHRRRFARVAAGGVGCRRFSQVYSRGSSEVGSRHQVHAGGPHGAGVQRSHLDADRDIVRRGSRTAGCPQGESDRGAEIGRQDRRGRRAAHRANRIGGHRSRSGAAAAGSRRADGQHVSRDRRVRHRL